ncbi:hypothetical protein QU866_17725, partial [Escherichia coli]|nr:hypothetical protein [Escherichia coli]
MECQNRSDKYIWSPHDAYFYKGLSELIVDIDRLIYLSLEKIRKDFVFINLSTDSLSEFINRDGNDSNLLIVFYVQIMPDDFVMQLHR